MQLKFLTLQQYVQNEPWRLALAHDLADHFILFLTRGQGRLILDGQRRGIGVNNLLSIPARSLFSAELGRQCVGQIALVPAGYPITLPRTPVHMRLRDVAEISEITSLFDGAAREATQQRPLKEQALDAHLQLVAVWLRRHMAEDTQVLDVPDAASRLTARFFERITGQSASTDNVADHGVALDVTPTHLSRACKAATGKTAIEILTERRLYEARMALTETDAPLYEIARHLGFGSAPYFTRFIQQHTGQTPSALRRNKYRA